MIRISSICAVVFLAGLIAAPAAQAQLTFSVDLQGPQSIPSGGPLSGADLLVPTPPAPGPGPLPMPTVAVPAAALGVFPGFQNAAEIDALSFGKDIFELGIMFSVDEFAAGAPGSPLPPCVATEGVAGAAEASADVFRYLGPIVQTPPGSVAGNTAVYDGDGLIPSGAPGLGLIEPNPPTPNTIPDPGDNLDAMVTGLQQPTVYFSMDSAFADPLEVPGFNTGTAVANGFVGGDVVVSGPAAGPMVYAPAAALGLDLNGPDTDDLDALLLWEDGDGEFTRNDWLLFSVRRGSAVIGMLDSVVGVPIEEGDILMAPAAPGMTPGIFIAAEALGLATARSGAAGQFGADDLDALAVPEPATLALLTIGAVALVRRRRS